MNSLRGGNVNLLSMIFLFGENSSSAVFMSSLHSAYLDLGNYCWFNSLCI